MHLSFRDLKQQKWTIEVDPTLTVAQVKAQNAQEREFADNLIQKFIHSGKILKDSDIIGDLKYNESKDFIVCMVTKAPAKKTKPATTPAQSDSVPSQSKTEAPIGGSSNGGDQSSDTGRSESTLQSGESRLFNNHNAFATGAMHEAAVQGIVEMGYPKEQVLVAMQMAYNNPDRAVEYIVTGEAEARMLEIEERNEQAENAESETEHSPAPALAQAQTQAVSGNSNEEDNEGETTDINLFERLAQHAQGEGQNVMPNLADLEDAIVNNPAMLDPIISGIASANPQLAADLLEDMRAISQIERYRRNTGEDGDEDMAGDDDQDEDYGDLPPGHVVVELTADEDQAIGRLMELGFPRGVVIQAYIACDKNEEIAANYLFEHGGD